MGGGPQGRREKHCQGTRQNGPVTSGEGAPVRKDGPQGKGPSNCLAKTQAYAKPEGEVYGLTPARCWKVNPAGLLRLRRVLPPRPMLRTCVPAVLLPCSTGISTCCPSATRPRLALGPDLPRADQLYPGILGYSAKRIPTSFSLLIPAFSLPGAPQCLPALLPRPGDAPLPMHPWCIPELRRRVSAPDIFGAGLLD